MLFMYGVSNTTWGWDGKRSFGSFALKKLAIFLSFMQIAASMNERIKMQSAKKIKELYPYRTVSGIVTAHKMDDHNLLAVEYSVVSAPTAKQIAPFHPDVLRRHVFQLGARVSIEIAVPTSKISGFYKTPVVVGLPLAS